MVWRFRCQEPAILRTKPLALVSLIHNSLDQESFFDFKVGSSRCRKQAPSDRAWLVRIDWSSWLACLVLACQQIATHSQCQWQKGSLWHGHGRKKGDEQEHVAARNHGVIASLCQQ